MKKVFITGADGFVGAQLITELKKRNISFVPGTRALYGDIAALEHQAWGKLLDGCDTVIHLAARVHVMNDNALNPIELYRSVNVMATSRLAMASKNKGVKRFIYLSSVKVNGEETFELPFKADDKASPQDAYGISKYEAELELLKLNEPGIFEVVILRPPLIYGPGVKANFEKFYQLISREWPLPFASVNNKRSLISILNLVDIILLASTHPKACGEIFLVSDDNDLSLPQLAKRIAFVQNKKIKLWPVPLYLMKFAAMLLGKKSLTDRLFGSLQLDIEKTKKMLEWKPPYTFEDTFIKKV